MLRFSACIFGAHAKSKTAALAVEFDDALARLELLPRMFIEPDGSFVWRGTSRDGQLWQVDGNLIDRGDVLAYVDVSGRCPEEQFDELLGALGWPEEPLAFELTRRGVVLDEQTFRKLARTPEGAI